MIEMLEKYAKIIKLLNNKWRDLMNNRSLRVVMKIMVMQVVMFAIMFGILGFAMSSNAKKEATQSMLTVAEDRAKLIQDFVEEAELYLTIYSRSDEVINALKNPDDEDSLQKAQQLTETVSKDKVGVEGIYISTWDTHVLTHNINSAIGMTMREGDSLATLQNSLQKAGDKAYTAGMMISPSSKKQVLPIYKAVFDEDNTIIGFVGAGILTESLTNELDSLSNLGMNNMHYQLLDLSSLAYLFCNDAEKIGTISEESYAKDIANSSNNNGTLSFVENNEKYVASFQKMNDRNWVLVLTDPETEVYEMINKIQQSLIIIALVGLVVLFIGSYIVIDRLLKPVRAAENVLSKVKDGDLTNHSELHKYEKRKDELGRIAKSTETLAETLENVIQTIKDCSRALNEKTVQLNGHSDNLITCVSENTITIEELSKSQLHTNEIVDEVKAKIEEINRWMKTSEENLEGCVSVCSNLIGKSQAMKGQADNSYNTSVKTFEKTKIDVQEAMERLRTVSQINNLADAILEISEQTNLLSLNASIEAARAGDAGRGFAVVAGEIGSLASTSQNTASNIQELCSRVNESVTVVDNCFNMIMQFLEGAVMTEFQQFALNAKEYNNLVTNLQESIQDFNESTESLGHSLLEISESISAVQDITHSNDRSIEMISQKNHTTASVADAIQEQSDSNSELAVQLKELVGKYKTAK